MSGFAQFRPDTMHTSPKLYHVHAHRAYAHKCGRVGRMRTKRDIARQVNTKGAKGENQAMGAYRGNPGRSGRNRRIGDMGRN